MQYDLQNGKDLLNRISIMYDYLRKCEERVDRNPTNEQAIITDFIDFMHDDICNSMEFEYNNLHAPEAFTIDVVNQQPQLSGLKLKDVDRPVANILADHWQQVLDKLHIYQPKDLIKQEPHIAIADLLILTKHPHQYIIWKYKHVQQIKLSDFKITIQNMFPSTIIKDLIN